MTSVGEILKLAGITIQHRGNNWGDHEMPREGQKIAFVVCPRSIAKKHSHRIADPVKMEASHAYRGTYKNGRFVADAGHQLVNLPGYSSGYGLSTVFFNSVSVEATKKKTFSRRKVWFWIPYCG